MAEIMWCLNHKFDAIIYNDIDTNFHIDWVKEELCRGPFFTFAPPVLEDNWQDELVEPSDEELKEMDAGAELLLWDLGLAEK